LLTEHASEMSSVYAPLGQQRADADADADTVDDELVLENELAVDDDELVVAKGVDELLPVATAATLKAAVRAKRIERLKFMFERVLV
jgi:hypothetical protein